MREGGNNVSDKSDKYTEETNPRDDSGKKSKNCGK